MTSAPLAALIAFASRSAENGQGDVDHVMRVLADHDGWIVPAGWAQHVWGMTTFEHLLQFPEVAPTPVLGVFTDLESAQLVRGQVGGAYGGPVRGSDLLRSLAGWSSIMVNPASPREHQWFIAAGGFEIAGRWASTIVVERALAELGRGSAPAPELLAHRYEILIDRQTGAPAQVALPDVGDVAVAFTAADRTEEFMSSLPRELRDHAETVGLDGPQLFELILSLGVAGVVVNAGSDDQTALAREDLGEVVSSR